MDIDFSLPEPKEGNRNFRISAKNWANLKNRDFGSSNLAYTLLRTIGEEGTDLYGYIMSDDKRSDRSITQAHKVAKLSTILDILMGYSQSENFADTIVINDLINRYKIQKPQLFTNILNFVLRSNSRIVSANSITNYLK